jgi:hypothetical protein
MGCDGLRGSRSQPSDSPVRDSAEAILSRDRQRLCAFCPASCELSLCPPPKWTYFGGLRDRQLSDLHCDRGRGSTLGGRAGTGKSALALAAGLVWVLKRQAHRKVMVFDPLVTDILEDDSL